MVREVEWLSRPVRGRVVARYSGQLLLVIAALLVPPAAVAAAAGDTAFLVRSAGTIAVLAAAGLALSRVSSEADVRPAEGMVIAAGAFLAAALAMVPAMASSGLPLRDVVFECISGVTTTGLTTVASIETQPVAFLFGRAWMQWFGGLGIAVFALVFVTRPGTAARQLMEEEGDHELAGSTRERARRVLRAYLVLTLVTAAAIVATGVTAWNGVLYALASVSTGGFAPHDASLLALGGPGRAGVVLGLCAVGAAFHAFYRPTRRGRLREIATDMQVRGLLVAMALLGAALLLTLHGVGGLAWSEALVEAPVLAATAQTTTGFSRLAPGGLDGASKILVIGAMLVGGGIGSTAGGVKLLRLLLLLRAIQVLVARTCLPQHAVSGTWLGGRPVEDAELREALLVILLFVLALGLSWLPFVAAGHDPLDALFDVASALGTVGLSTGVVGPDLEGYLKGVLCADMLLGRLEIVAWLVILYPRTWIGRGR